MFIMTILLFFCLLCAGCSQNTENSAANNYVNEDNLIEKSAIHLPDTSINGQLFLRSPNSILKVLGDISAITNTEADISNAYIFNKSCDQYLKLFFHPGDVANCASLFEVGAVADAPSGIKYNTSLFDGFCTENNIGLGLSRKQVENKKGSNYVESKDGDNVLLTYIISNEDSEILYKYNMPEYIAQYWFVNGKLVKYRFGFMYP